MIVEGLPAGLAVTVEDIQAELARRRLGYGRGPRQRFEVDELTLLGGVRHGRTIGSPVAIEIKNTEWFRSDKWHAEMSPAPGRRRRRSPRCDRGTPTWPGCRSTGSPMPATSSSGRAPARPPPESPPERSPSCCSPSSACDVLSHVVQMGSGRATGGPPDARRPGAGRRVAGALLRPGRGRGDDPRGQGGGEGRRLARRGRRGPRRRGAGRARQPRPLGSQARRACSPAR